MKIVIKKIVAANGHMDNNRSLPLISKESAQEYCNSCWPNEDNNFINGFIWTQYLTKEDYKLYTKDPEQRHEIKKQIISLLNGNKLKSPEKRIKELEKALKAVMRNFPEEVLKDQMNEDFFLIEKALKK